MNYNLLIAQIELKKKQIELKQQEFNNKDVQIEQKQKHLHLNEKRIINERKKIAQKKQLDIDEHIKIFSKLIHNTNKTGEINSKQISAMKDITISSQILEQLLQ